MRQKADWPWQQILEPIQETSRWYYAKVWNCGRRERIVIRHLGSAQRAGSPRDRRGAVPYNLSDPGIGGSSLRVQGQDLGLDAMLCGQLLPGAGAFAKDETTILNFRHHASHDAAAWGWGC